METFWPRPRDIAYGRIKLILGQGLKNPRTAKKFVTIAYFTQDYAPPYAVGDYLLIETETQIYHIFNPMQIAFDINVLMSVLKTFHNEIGEPIISWDIVREARPNSNRERQ